MRNRWNATEGVGISHSQCLSQSPALLAAGSEVSTAPNEVGGLLCLAWAFGCACHLMQSFFFLQHKAFFRGSKYNSFVCTKHLYSTTAVTTEWRTALVVL